MAAEWPRIGQGPRRSRKLFNGSVSERPKVQLSKSCVGESPPWVQIPPGPPCDVSRHRKPPNLRVRGFLSFLPLIVTARIKGQLSDKFSGCLFNDADLEAVDEHDDARVFVGPPDSYVVKFSSVSERDDTSGVDFVIAHSCVSGEGCRARLVFGESVVCMGGGLSAQRPVGPVVVVFGDELINMVLEFLNRVGGALFAKPVLHCLLETFNFPAGRGVSRG